MTVSMIDATVVSVDQRSARAGVRIFKTVTMQLATGKERVLSKIVTTDAVGEGLVAGATGRFYLNSVMGMHSIHGWRLADGRAVFGFPENNTKAFVIAGVVGVAWVLLMLFTRGAVPLLGVAGAALGCTGWYLTGQTRREASAQFAADGN